MKTDIELTVRWVENGYIVLDEKGREFVWHNWRACEQSMAKMFDAAKSRRNASSEVPSTQVDTNDQTKLVPLAWQSPPEGLTENARERLERAKVGGTD